MGFRKAKAEQAALKIGIYGPPGSGKTFTSLLIAEGLALRSGKRVAFVDTERGTDFYCKAVQERKYHPEAFDFDALYTRSITETLAAVKSLSADTYGVVVIDSITHLWQACIAAYAGKTTRAGTIPMHAWGAIKKSYKELMSILLGSQMHVVICGRQGNEYATDDDTDELKCIGVKMKAEGETPYEPHILLRMESIKPTKPGDVATIRAFAEKDRTGVLSGRIFLNPTFDSLCGPLLGLLGGKQAHVDTDDEVATHDAETLADEDNARHVLSLELLAEFNAKFDLAKTKAEVEAVSKSITPAIKKQMLTAHVTALREKYQARTQQVTGGVRLETVEV